MVHVFIMFNFQINDETRIFTREMYDLYKKIYMQR